MLLIDDDTEEHDIMCESLAEVSSELTCLYAKDFSEAIRIIGGTEIDLIFLDLNMPKEDGYQVLNKLKANQVSKDLPVLIYSNGVSSDVCQKISAHGAVGCVRKADTVPLLTSNIKKLLTRISSEPFVAIL